MPQQAYIGTYTDGTSEGLYTYDVTVQNEELAMQRRAVTPLEDNPSFLAVHPSDEYLYAIHEVEDGGVTAFRREDDGSLNCLNRVPSGAGGPCHCSVHPSGEYLFVAHYAGGAVSALPIGSDGSLSRPSDIVHHEGSGVHPERQTHAHPHSITPGPNGHYLYVPDLGTDDIVSYEFDNGTLIPAETTSVSAGAGPRHLDFHPNERVAYVINELDSTVAVFGWSPETGTLDELAALSTLPTEYQGSNTAADIHVHPSGNWVYGSNRGHDSIITFRVDEDGRDLTAIDHQSTDGEGPRNFALDTSGQVLFAENQYSDTIVAFRIDDETGMLESTGLTVQVPSPVCLYCLPVCDTD
ncbi:MAG TPA: lactonase family protein [Halococcus sp.]|nr:lactonase family protein [Halococcus sp.]